MELDKVLRINKQHDQSKIPKYASTTLIKNK